jgi:hypothetical protein
MTQGSALVRPFIARMLFASMLFAPMLFASGWARAADRCAWTDPGKKPRLYVDDRVVVFRDYYSPEWAACVMGQGTKDFEVQWIVGADPRAAPVETEKVHLYAGNDDGPRKAEVKLFPNHICEDKGPRPPGKLITTGMPGREYLATTVPVRVRVVASGALQPLAYTSAAVEVPCRACGSDGRGSLQVNQDPNQKDLVLEGEADRDWFECAAQGGTLALLGFGGRSSAEVTVAIRPDLTIGGLEKEFVRKGDKYVLRRPLPLSRLCARGAKVWSFEAWGRGELMHLGGGGRSIHDLRCQ